MPKNKKDMNNNNNIANIEPKKKKKTNLENVKVTTNFIIKYV
jgi:hypothetical protein